MQLSVVLIDCVDSFTYLLKDLCIQCKVDARVELHTEFSANATHIIIGPGPGHPDEYRHLFPLIQNAKVPILGVCLGHQLIVQAFGGQVGRASKPMHGKLSVITHCQSGLFDKLSNPMPVGRYHSLVAQSIPESLSIDAVSQEGEVMAISHITKPIYGVQFHPESFLTKNGSQIIHNFISRNRVLQEV